VFWVSGKSQKWVDWTRAPPPKRILFPQQISTRFLGLKEGGKKRPGISRGQKKRRKRIAPLERENDPTVTHANCGISADRGEQKLGVGKVPPRRHEICLTPNNMDPTKNTEIGPQAGPESTKKKRFGGRISPKHPEGKKVFYPEPSLKNGDGSCRRRKHHP